MTSLGLLILLVPAMILGVVAQLARRFASRGAAVARLAVLVTIAVLATTLGYLGTRNANEGCPPEGCMFDLSQIIWIITGAVAIVATLYTLDAAFQLWEGDRRSGGDDGRPPSTQVAHPTADNDDGIDGAGEQR